MLTRLVQSSKLLSLSLFTFACQSGAPAPTPAGSAASAAPAAKAEAETIRVAIGTQDTTINCAAGGPLVRELKLLEKYLPKTGRYQNAKYDIQWENQPTGAQLNSKYLANQLDIVQMADFPSVIGATALKAANNEPFQHPWTIAFLK